MRYNEGGASIISIPIPLIDKPNEQTSLHTSRRIEISFVQHFDERDLLRLRARIHFEVSSDKELARHDGREEGGK
jgi:hypothetical protein